MTNTFFIADTHFGHKNIIKFDSTKAFRNFATIEDHDEELIRRWNSVVGKNDIVWVLGDFCFGKDKLEIAGRLKGSKRLVMGNHDMYAGAAYLKYFTRVCGVVQFNTMILSHIPVHPNQLERYSHNIHGHLHSKNVLAPTLKQVGNFDEAAEFSLEKDKRYINVSAEQIDLTPISYEELMKKT